MNREPLNPSTVHPADVVAAKGIALLYTQMGDAVPEHIAELAALDEFTQEREAVK